MENNISQQNKRVVNIYHKWTKEEPQKQHYHSTDWDNTHYHGSERVNIHRHYKHRF